LHLSPAEICDWAIALMLLNYRKVDSPRSPPHQSANYRQNQSVL